jgi:polyphosphate kinase
MIFKMNQLVDDRLIRKLYRASQAGVPIDLIVRGVCCLRPGLPGISETIRVSSIVGRFLEHSRIYHFQNGGEAEAYVGSADLMPRNLDRRVELLFPIRDPQIRDYLRYTLLEVELRNTTCARELLPDGSYVKRSPAPGDPAVDSQTWLLSHPALGGRGRPYPVHPAVIPAEAGKRRKLSGSS